MTTPCECFKKQVKSNTCKAFNMFIKIIILMIPTIIFVGYWISLPSVDVNNIHLWLDRVKMLIVGGLISMIIDIIYWYIVAVPFINCYYSED